MGSENSSATTTALEPGDKKGFTITSIATLPQQKPLPLANMDPVHRRFVNQNQKTLSNSRMGEAVDRKKFCDGNGFIFSCPQQLNRTSCPSLGLTPLTIRVFTSLQSDPRDLRPLRHLIRGMRRHYYLPANLPPTYLHTYLPTYLH